MRKKISIAAISALIFFIALETIMWVVLPSSSQAVIPPDVERIYPDSEYYVYGYHIANNRFTPFNSDPQIGFELPGRELRSVIVEFEGPLKRDMAIEVYYASDDEPLTEGRCVKATGKKGDTAAIIELQYGEYTHIRLDLNGSFVLSGIGISRSEPTFRIMKGGLDTKAIFLVGVLASLLVFSLVLLQPFLTDRLKACSRYAKELFVDNSPLIESQIIRQSVLWALVLTLIAAILFLGVIPARFETNDDVVAADIAYGHNGQYSGYLIIVNVVIGKIINICMMALPAVPWYTIFQVILICAAFIILLSLLFQKFGTQGFFPAVILMIYFGYQFISRLQFTKTAGISVTAGFLLLFDAIKHKKCIFAYLIGGGMIVAGSLYRFKVLEMLCIPFFGVGVQLLWEYAKERNIKKLLHLCILFVAVFAVCFGLKALDSWTYQQDAQWAYYHEFNSLRAQLLDYGFPDYQENQTLYESLGISQNDYELYRNWDISDPERFNVENLRQLVGAKEPQKFNWALIRGCVEKITLGMLQYRYIFALLIAFFTYLLFTEKKNLFLLVYLCVSFWFVQLYLYYRGRYLQSRVDVCLILAVTMIILLCLWPRQLFRQTGIAVSMAGVLLMMAVPQHLTYLTTEREDSMRYLYQLFQSDPGHLYMGAITDNGSPFELWDTGTLGMKANYALIRDWRTNSPHYRRPLDTYGVENPYRDVVDNQNVYLICNSGLDKRMTHIQEHYAPDAEAYLVRNIDNKCYLYRIATAEAPPRGIESARHEDGIGYGVNIQPLEDGHVRISGFLYKEGTNSFASNIYLALRTPDNEEHFYYTTQTAAFPSGDALNDVYSEFSRELEAPQPGTSVVLYLETDDTIYRVETDISLQ